MVFGKYHKRIVALKKFYQKAKRYGSILGSLLDAGATNGEGQIMTDDNGLTYLVKHIASETNGNFSVAFTASGVKPKLKDTIVSPMLKLKSDKEEEPTINLKISSEQPQRLSAEGGKQLQGQPQKGNNINIKVKNNGKAPNVYPLDTRDIDKLENEVKPELDNMVKKMRKRKGGGKGAKFTVNA